MTETEEWGCKPYIRLATCMLLATCLKSSTKFWSSMNEQFSDPRFFERSIYSKMRSPLAANRTGPSEGKTSESAVNLANRSTKHVNKSVLPAAKISVCRWCAFSHPSEALGNIGRQPAILVVQDRSAGPKWRKGWCSWFRCWIFVAERITENHGSFLRTASFLKGSVPHPVAQQIQVVKALADGPEYARLVARLCVLIHPRFLRSC